MRVDPPRGHRLQGAGAKRHVMAPRRPLHYAAAHATVASDNEWQLAAVLGRVLLPSLEGTRDSSMLKAVVKLLCAIDRGKKGKREKNGEF